jgi:hypothetical protein
MINHAQQDDIHPTNTLCGKKKEDYLAAGEGCYSVPVPGGIADPNWITCPTCRERLNEFSKLFLSTLQRAGLLQTR